MPLHDLLWACPACKEDRGLVADDETCTGCGTRYTRGSGSSIRSIRPDGRVETRSPAEWLDMLPPPASLLENDPVRIADVGIKPVTGETTVFGRLGFLNRIEVFGDEQPGAVRLYRDALLVGGPQDGKEARKTSRSDRWGLDSLTAVQTSSKSLQLKRRDHPLVSFRFLNDSVYLWEQLIRAALRDFYGRAGRGTIREFQPKIVAR